MNKILKIPVMIAMVILTLLFIIQLILGLSYQDKISDSNCTGDYCSSAYLISNESSELPNNYEVSEEINCENFIWIENYIKSAVEGKEVTSNQLQVIELLKQANFGLQDELLICEEKLKNNQMNIYVTYFAVALAVILALWKTVEIIKRRMEE